MGELPLAQDTEIEAMAAVTRALEGLDEAARRRVLEYAASRFLGQQSVGRAAADAPRRVFQAHLSLSAEMPRVKGALIALGG